MAAWTQVAVTKANVKRIADECEMYGPVTRYRCRRCGASLAAIDKNGQSLLSLGCLEDASLPLRVAKSWKANSVADETTVRATRNRKTRRSAPQRLRGGCACGGCRFVATAVDAIELQHCYCETCRRASGSIGQTWVPLQTSDVTWKQTRLLDEYRYTSHATRHRCAGCGGVLTIRYDDSPEELWVAAGAIDDASLKRARVDGVSHICVAQKPRWYRLPDDGMPRIRGAS